jgi:hypothetical protein
MDNITLVAAPTSLLQCFDEDGEISLEKFFAYRRKQDEELQQENDRLQMRDFERGDDVPLHAQRQIRVRRFKRHPSAILLPSGETFQVNPRSSVWYTMYVGSPAIDDRNFHKMFGLRFRVPYNFFISLSQEMKINAAFERWSGQPNCTGTPSTPIELLILASLRILGRDWKLDDFQETIGVSHMTIRLFFHKFCEYGATVLYDRYVKCPQSRDELYNHMQEYSRLGLNGCVGSMDTTHVQSCQIPGELVQAHSSFKSSHPARAYNITVNHNRKILYSTRRFPGRWNDKTIVKFDKLFCHISDGTIGSDVHFFVLFRFCFTDRKATKIFRCMVNCRQWIPNAILHSTSNESHFI